MAKVLSEASILMISLDPQFLKKDSEVFKRHRQYAQNLKRLDVIVMAGAPQKSFISEGNLAVQGVGGGLGALKRAYDFGQLLFKKHHYHLIDTQDPHATALVGYGLAKRFSCPLELHFHGDFWDNDYWQRESWKNKIYNLLQKFIVRRAVAIRVVSPLIKEKLVRAGLSADKIAVIHTPVNEALFGQRAQESAVRQIREKYGKKILLFVGRLAAAKNLPFLLEAVKELRKRRDDFVLLIIGDGPEKNRLLFLIKKYRLEQTVFLLGGKEPHHLLDYYQAAYLLLLLSSNESFGKVIIEAGWQGTPTLASDTLGAQTIIRDKHTGWLLPIHHLAITVDKLDLLLTDHQAVQRAGQLAQADFSENYSQARTRQQILDFWQKIIS